VRRSFTIVKTFFTKLTTADHTATAESAKTLTGLATVNNANKIATRLVYDTPRVELVWANMIEGAPMPRHQVTRLSNDGAGRSRLKGLTPG
jgi:hypothetical protein